MDVAHDFLSELKAMGQDPEGVVQILKFGLKDESVAKRSRIGVRREELRVEG
jgi:hypothetical protein